MRTFSMERETLTRQANFHLIELSGRVSNFPFMQWFVKGNKVDDMQGNPL